MILYDPRKSLDVMSSILGAHADSSSVLEEKRQNCQQSSQAYNKQQDGLTL